MSEELDVQEYVITDEDDVEKRSKVKRKDRTKREVERDDIRYVVSTDQGRRFVRRLLRVCRVNNLSYTRSDAFEMAFNEGHRNVGNQLIAMVGDADENALALMMIEERKGKKSGRKTN